MIGTNNVKRQKALCSSDTDYGEDLICGDTASCITL
jgi:hypothetical protein